MTEIEKQRQEFKRKLTDGFHALRWEHKYFAAQCFQCCQTCGCASVPDEYAEHYVFYHEQRCRAVGRSEYPQKTRRLSLLDRRCRENL